MNDKWRAQNLRLGDENAQLRDQLNLSRVHQSNQARQIERLEAWINDLCTHYHAERWGRIADMIAKWEGDNAR